MLNRILLLGLVSALLGCEDRWSAARQVEQPTVGGLNTQAATASSCEDALTVLVRYSSFASGFRQTLRATVEEQNDEQLTLRMVVSTDGEAGPEAVVGWVRLVLANHQLLDLTNDAQYPVPLSFRSADWNRAVACSQSGRAETVTCTDVFPQGAVIAFTFAQLNRPDSVRHAFRRRLAAYERQHPMPANLQQLVNYEVFSSHETYELTLNLRENGAVGRQQFYRLAFDKGIADDTKPEYVLTAYLKQDNSAQATSSK